MPIIWVKIRASIWTAPSWCSLGTYLAADLVMSTGMALQFAERHGSPRSGNPVRSGKYTLQEGIIPIEETRPGDIIPVPSGPCYIYYMINRQGQSHRAIKRNVRKTVTALKQHMERHQIHQLGIPVLTTETLEFGQIQVIFNEEFSGLNVTIYVYDPNLNEIYQYRK